MTSFDATTTGTSEDAWRAAGWLRNGPTWRLTAGRPLVVLAAHADDETLGAGGLIGAASDAGSDVKIIIASDGAASHPDSPTVTPSELAASRVDEATRAIAILAPCAEITFLRLPDGALVRHRPEIESALAGLLPADAVLACPWAHDRHPDHETCSLASRRVLAAGARAELVEFPIWAWHWGDPLVAFVELDPAAVRSVSLPLSPALRERKSRAVAQYVTQIRPLSGAVGDEAVLTASTLAHFTRDHEFFLAVEPGRSGDG